MALTGEITYKGLTVSDAYIRVVRVLHLVDYSSGSKVLTADYSAKIYKDVDTCTADPNNEITTISGTFTPSVSNNVNLNIVKQTYVYLKTLADYDELTDV
tara:strand:- start:2541 stop:2840 length:300 start_codon:yes stop_codon:yes gene_type:complete